MTKLNYPASLERELGYQGQDRFVLFYFDPRSRQIIWRDAHSSGAASGAQSPLIDQLQASARALGVSVGSQSGPGDHALLVDRVGRHASFTFRERAQEFLARQLAAAATCLS